MTAKCDGGAAARAAMQEAAAQLAQAVLYSAGHNEGWKRALDEYESSNGKDFGYPIPFDEGTPQYDGYCECVKALDDDWDQDDDEFIL